jgi:hypothetical protein
MMKEILKYIKLYTGCNDHTIKRIEVMLENKLQPQVIEKIVHVEKIVARKKRPITPLSVWADTYYLINNTSYEYISQKRRLQEVVDDRNHFIKNAYFEGYRPTEIARYIKRNHATILHVISK